VKSGVAVLGAGLSGLGFGLTLPEADIYEAEPYPGGRAYSREFEGYWFDDGAHISHTTNDHVLTRVIRAAKDVNVIEQSTVHNFWLGATLTYPVQNHLFELPLDLRIRALTDLIMAHLEPPAAASPADYEAWCLKEYGRALTEQFYRVFTEKYWRAPMHALAVDWLGGRLLPSLLPTVIRGALTDVPEGQASFRRFYYPRKGGFFEFFAPLYEGLNVYYNERAVEIDTRRKKITFASGRSEHYEALVSSLPLDVLVAAIPEAPAQVREAAQKLTWTRLVCVNMLVELPPRQLPHWLYIYDPDIAPSRVSFPANLAGLPGEGAPVPIQAEVFRRRDEPFDPSSTVCS